MGGFDEDLKYQPSANSLKKFVKTDLEITINFTFPFLCELKGVLREYRDIEILREEIWGVC